jgi:hypothetical protein
MEDANLLPYDDGFFGERLALYTKHEHDYRLSYSQSTHLLTNGVAQLVGCRSSA